MPTAKQATLAYTSALFNKDTNFKDSHPRRIVNFRQPNIKKPFSVAQG
jgi:hypothetical protein